MRSLSVLIILLFLFLSDANAQLNLTVGEKFLDGKAIKLVFVAVNDHSVWALTTEGKVYLKRQNQLDFLLYQPTATFEIDQVTGFNENEMFFLLKPDIIIHFKAGIKYEIKVPFPEVTRINDIAAVHSNTSSSYYINNPTTVLPDYLAVATNKHLYKLIRGSVVISEQVPYVNAPIVNEPDWRMTNKGYKSIDFQYRYPEIRYCKTADHTTLSYIGGPIAYTSVLPDQVPDYSRVNASLIAVDWLRYATAYVMNFWGNDNGLYVKDIYNCTDPIKQVIANEKINDLEEIFALTPIYRQNFVLAATDNGLYYTPASVFHELYGYLYATNVKRVNFVKHTLFPSEKIYSLCSDTKQESVIDISSGSFALSVCEKVIWVASSTGLRKVYGLLDQDYYNDFLYSDFQYHAIPKNTGDFSKTIFETCGNQTIPITAKIPEVSKSEVMIKWYKDNEEIRDWVDKLTVNLSESGTYKVKITVLCENISLTSIPIIIINNPDPEITFTPPANVNICNAQPYVMETKYVDTYSYQWYKDEVKIPSATQSGYVATVSGKYRVEVNNNTCPGPKSSPSVSINFINMPIPQLLKDKTNYCIGDVAELSVANYGYDIKWYIDGAEISGSNNKDKITIVQPGTYHVEFISSSCINKSIDHQITFNQPPTANVTRSSDRVLCYGETVDLVANDIAGASYLWSNGEKTRTINVSNSGKYSVQVTSQFGCTSMSEEMEVIINSLPQVLANEQLKLCMTLNEKVKLNAIPGYAYYIWNGKRSTESYLMVNQPGLYTLVIEDANGCQASKTFEVNSYCKEIIAPNAFSPNNDGINDIWKISGLENMSNTNIKIFNRWGTKVHEGTGSDFVWNGNINNSPAPIGVYYYVITSSTIQSIRGTITLIR